MITFKTYLESFAEDVVKSKYKYGTPEWWAETEAIRKAKLLARRAEIEKEVEPIRKYIYLYPNLHVLSDPIVKKQSIFGLVNSLIGELNNPNPYPSKDIIFSWYRIDPSNDKRYIDWVLKQYSERKIKDEDYDRVRNVLRDFEYCRLRGNFKLVKFNMFDDLPELERYTAREMRIIREEDRKKEELRKIALDRENLIKSRAKNIALIRKRNAKESAEVRKEIKEWEKKFIKIR